MGRSLHNIPVAGENPGRVPGRGAQLSPRASLRLLFYLGLFLFVGTSLAACGGATPTPTTAPLDPALARGKQLFARHCAACHAVEPETVIVGPSLAGIASRADNRVAGMAARDYIQLSILHPGDYVVPGFEDTMPSTFGKQLTGEELDALVAYLMTFE